MERTDILAVIEKHLQKSVPTFAGGIVEEKMFSDYGANSLDIVEIVSGSMRELKVKIPRTELSEIKNIAGLVDKFVQHAK